MSNFTFTANTADTIATGFYGYSNFYSGTQAGQGAYRNSTSASSHNASRIGIISFTGAGSALKNSAITSITLTLVAKASGYGADRTKTLTFCKSNYQSIDKTLSGTNYVGATLGTLQGSFYNNTSTFTLNSSSNASLFNALKDYLASGNSTIILYNGETPPDTVGTYSANYANFTSVTISVEYDESFVYYNYNGTAVKCAVYYNNGGTAVRCAAEMKQ